MAKISGTIKCFFREKKFGFITDSNSGKDIYFHVAALREELINMPTKEMIGKSVAFKVGKNAKGLKAVEVIANKKAINALQNDTSSATEVNEKNVAKVATTEVKAKRSSVDNQDLIQNSTPAHIESSAKNNIENKTDDTKELSRFAAYKQKSDTVTTKFLKVTKLDDPRLVELVKVKMVNFALIHQYKFKIGFSKAALAFVRVSDRLLGRLEEFGKGLSKTKRPSLKSI